MRTLTISNQKGGVAKTTTALALAAAFAEMGHRVLACDLDPQGNLTLGFGVEPDAVERGTLDLLLGGEGPADLSALVRREVSPGIDLLPASLTLAGAERRLFGEVGFDEALRRGLARRASGYGVVVIDAPPSLGALTLNAITAADTVLVPVQCEVFSARGLGQLLEVADLVRARRNPALEVLVLPTLLDLRNRVSREILDELAASFGGQVLAPAIGLDTKVRESAAAGQPVIRYAPSARASAEYRAVAAALVLRGAIEAAPSGARAARTAPPGRAAQKKSPRARAPARQSARARGATPGGAR